MRAETSGLANFGCDCVRGMGTVLSAPRSSYMASHYDLTGEAVRGEIPTVLVVEDDYLMCMAIAEHLRTCGYRVLEASNADEAIAALKADANIDARINVVFTDVQMPGS